MGEIPWTTRNGVLTYNQKKKKTRWQDKKADCTKQQFVFLYNKIYIILCDGQHMFRPETIITSLFS